MDGSKEKKQSSRSTGEANLKPQSQVQD